MNVFAVIQFQKYYLSFLLFLLVPISLISQKRSSDNGDGTYTNPLIPADFPDPDVIFVNGTYYMVSTTMFVFPGSRFYNPKILSIGNIAAMLYPGLISVLVIISMVVTVIVMDNGRQA